MVLTHKKKRKNKEEGGKKPSSPAIKKNIHSGGIQGLADTTPIDAHSRMTRMDLHMNPHNSGRMSNYEDSDGDIWLVEHAAPWNGTG